MLAPLASRLLGQQLRRIVCEAPQFKMQRLSNLFKFQGFLHSNANFTALHVAFFHVFTQFLLVFEGSNRPLRMWSVFLLFRLGWWKHSLCPRLGRIARGVVFNICWFTRFYFVRRTVLVPLCFTWCRRTALDVEKNCCDWWRQASLQ